MIRTKEENTIREQGKDDRDIKGASRIIKKESMGKTTVIASTRE